MRYVRRSAGEMLAWAIIASYVLATSVIGNVWLIRSMLEVVMGL